MKINTLTKHTTHEGAPAKRINVKQELRRSLLSCMLWEKSFYEDGENIADRILRLAAECSAQFLCDLAIEARTVQKLRHAPLLILLELIKRGGPYVAHTIEQVINRPDEITELVALYWRNGKKPLSKQMKVGLGRAFLKFNEYQLAKWNRPADVKLRDVLFLVHAKPTKDKEQMFKRLANDELKTPNTWESRMAGGENKKSVFTDLLQSNSLGYMALLKNLRGMLECGVDRQLIKDAIAKPSPSVLPFRFLSAAKHASSLERDLDEAMIRVMEDAKPLRGKTILLIDVSASMDWARISSKSELTRLDAACALAILVSGVAEDLLVFTFSEGVIQVPARKGMALRDAIVTSQPHHGTRLGAAVRTVELCEDYDRLIVISDEQSCDRVSDPKGRAYMLNVATERNGVGYGKWIHIDGFSEACIEFIQEYERAAN